MLYNLFENRDFVSVFAVALREEGVDRNKIYGSTGASRPTVALREEGVDRNVVPQQFRRPLDVALREEGVDRNSVMAFPAPPPGASPSVRRAWIEIMLYAAAWRAARVALREEGVDRNTNQLVNHSSRRCRPP